MDGLPSSPNHPKPPRKHASKPSPNSPIRDHLLHEVLVIAVCGASFYEVEDFAGESEGWLPDFPLLPGGVPRHDTFIRVFQALCPHAFFAASALDTPRSSIDRKPCWIKGWSG